MSRLDHYLSEFARVERSLPGTGDPWLSQMRQGALERFREADFPSTRLENWKYTDVRPIQKHAFDVVTEDIGLTLSDIQPLLLEDLDAHRLVFVNGRYNDALSTVDGLPRGVQLSSLSQKLSAPDEVLRAHLDQIIDGQATAFSDLNGAFMSDGLFLSLEDGVVLDKPVHVLFIGTQTEHPAMAHVRNVFRLGAGAEASVIEHYAGMPDSQYFTNSVSEIVTERNAGLHFYKLQQESERAYHVAGIHARHARDSRFRAYTADLGGRLVRTDLNSRLDGEGADSRLYGVYVPRGKQHIDNHTRIDHASPHGTSREFYKGILDGRGRGVFNGKVVVHKHAQKTDSEQKSEALLLSKHAEVDAKPELEIYADDVKCQHGSTVGQLDEEAVFYLRSRGVDMDTARSLLTYSFADEVIREIRLEALRKHLEKNLLARLPGGAGIQEIL